MLSPTTGYCMFSDDPALAECFLQQPTFDAVGRHPMNFDTIQHYQQECAKLQQELQQHHDQLYLQGFGPTQLVCRVADDKLCCLTLLFPNLSSGIMNPLAMLKASHALRTTSSVPFGIPVPTLKLQNSVSTRHAPTKLVCWSSVWFLRPSRCSCFTLAGDPLR